MRPSGDDFLFTPEARLRELAGILATGMLRHLLRRAATPADDSENSSSASLEFLKKTCLVSTR